MKTNQRVKSRSLADAAERDWYALRVPPQREFVAQLLLERHGHATFVPVERKWRNWNRYTQRKGKVLREFPLLPRYVLIGFPGTGQPWQSRPWHDVFRLRVTRGVIGIDGEPYCIPFPSIERLIRLDAGGHFIAPKEQRYMRSRAEFKVGDFVRVVEGPFAGVGRVRVEEIVGPRAKLHLMAFGGEVRAEVPLELLEPAA